MKTPQQTQTLLQRFREESCLTLRALVYALAALLLTSQTIQVVQAAETVTYYHNDALGSPVAATDASGNVVWKEQYQPYGTRILHQGDASNDVWYTGKPEEAALGLQYFGARWYDPQLGRFTGVDPNGFAEGNIQSFNRYAYANNNPYSYVDPDGKFAILEVGLVVLITGAAIYTIAAAHNSSTTSNAQNINLNTPPSEHSGYINIDKYIFPGLQTSSKETIMMNQDGKKVDVNETGSYTNYHASGKTYSGKGSRKRSQISGRREEKANNDPHVATDFTSADSARDAFKDESIRLDDNGGVKDESNYNRIESPGKKYRQEDGEH